MVQLMDVGLKSECSRIGIRQLPVDCLATIDQLYYILDFVFAEAGEKTRPQRVRGVTGERIRAIEGHLGQGNTAKTHIRILPVNGKDAQ